MSSWHQHNSAIISLVIICILYCTITPEVLCMTTRELTEEVVQLYTRASVEEKLPCLLRLNCTICTEDKSCVWISGSPGNGIVVTRRDGEKMLDTREVSFCWSGDFWGAGQNSIGNVMTRRGEFTTIYAIFGFNDFCFKQCVVRGGILLVLIFAVPLIMLSALTSLPFVCFYCCCRKRMSKTWM